MTARQKFWLKVAVFVTCPAWVPIAVVMGMPALLGALMWSACCDMVDQLAGPSE